MGIRDSGNDVQITAGGASLANFAAATNVKRIGNVYDVTSGAAGTAPNGRIELIAGAGIVGDLSGPHVIQTNAYPFQVVRGNTASENQYIDLSGATLICIANTHTASEDIAPMKLDALSKIVWKGGTWSSTRSGVQIDGATIIFTGATDCHLGNHPRGYVRNVKLVVLGTRDANILMAAQPIWSGSGNNDKVLPSVGLSVLSVSGNELIVPFSWTNGSRTPWGAPTMPLMIYEDFGYNVGNGRRPTALRRAYRRGAYTVPSDATNSYRGKRVVLTYVWLDAYHQLAANGTFNAANPKIYLQQADYDTVGTSAAHTTSDLFCMTFKPQATSLTGAALSGVQIAVFNESTNTALTNAFGQFRARLSAYGTTGSDGLIQISEPTTKDYTTKTSYPTDSLCIANRNDNSVIMKHWQAGEKYIIVGDSRGSTGTTFGDTYDRATAFKAIYRKPGYIFTENTLNLTTPFAEAVSLSEDASYRAGAATTGISVSYSGTTTTVRFAANGTYNLDAIYKAVVDFHGARAQVEGKSKLPVTQGTGTFRYNSTDLVFDVRTTPRITFTAGQVLSLIETQTFPANITTDPQSVGLIDNNGNSFLTFQDIESWIVYATAANRATARNPVASGTGRYRFNFAANTTYYLKVVKNGTGFDQNITPQAAGETVVSLAVEALLLSLSTPAQTAQAVYAEFTRGTNANAFKADVSDLAAVKGKVEDLHDFGGLNPAARLTITPTQKSVNSKTTRITGDGITTATVQRTA